VLLSTHVRLLDGLEALLGSMPSSRLVPSLRHLAFVPDLCTLYAQVVPAPGAVESAARMLMTQGRDFVLSGGDASSRSVSAAGTK
ncbi:MAG: hypothetical protein JRG91_00970, partial [Deltaproteobacteria bacterium]|nr:hypothetical protein [Deltaproteobacteria bacterium]